MDRRYRTRVLVTARECRIFRSLGFRSLSGIDTDGRSRMVFNTTQLAHSGTYRAVGLVTSRCLMRGRRSYQLSSG
jgi:hypothetical protein